MMKIVQGKQAFDFTKESPCGLQTFPKQPFPQLQVEYGRMLQHLTSRSN